MQSTMSQSSGIRPGSNMRPIGQRSEADAGRFIAMSGRYEEEVTAFLNGLFESAIADRVSDIHFEIDEIENLRVRVRRGGILVVYDCEVTSEMARLAKQKICAKAKLDDQQRLREQDGRMMLFFGARRVDMRINITPTVSGYKIVCRILDSNNSQTSIDTIEMSHAVRSTMKRVVESPEGMLLMSGPTGSGKTTTLYSLLHYINDDERHILTIEEPVEYSVKGFTQIEVNKHMGWLSAIASSLRLDPDVIMIGEIRDDNGNGGETSQSADAAFRAGETGHFVLSTVHANNAITTIMRLLKLGVPATTVARTLKAVVAQRLVPKIINGSTLKWEDPTQVEVEWLKRYNAYAEGMRLPHIQEGGFSGRLPVIEMIEIDTEMKAVLNEKREDNWEIRLGELAARQPQFETLAQAGIRLVLAGLTTLDEIIKITSDVSHVPRYKRFEQVLVQRGIITGKDVDEGYAAVDVAREHGQIMTLDAYFLSANLCSVEQVESAKKASHETINT